MNRAFFRSLAHSLLWLLAVTLPLQGFASAVRSCCVDELAVAVTAAPAPPQVQHCHSMADMAGMQVADQSVPMKMAMDDGAASHQGHDCGNHGACTVGATAPPGMITDCP